MMYASMMAAALSEPSMTYAVLSALMWPAVPFYITLNSAMELVLVALLVFWNWDTDGRRRALILAAVAAYFVIRVWTYLVFAETRLDIARHALSPGDVEWFKQTLATDFRTVFNLIAYVCLILAALLPPWPASDVRAWTLTIAPSTQTVGRVMSTVAVSSIALASFLALISLGGGLYEFPVVDSSWPRRPDIIQPNRGAISRKRFWIPAHAAIELASDRGSPDGMIAYAFLQQRHSQQQGGKNELNGPPPQPTLPAVRQAILELIKVVLAPFANSSRSADAPLRSMLWQWRLCSFVCSGGLNNRSSNSNESTQIRPVDDVARETKVADVHNPFILPLQQNKILRWPPAIARVLHQDRWPPVDHAGNEMPVM